MTEKEYIKNNLTDKEIEINIPDLNTVKPMNIEELHLIDTDYFDIDFAKFINLRKIFFEYDNLSYRRYIDISVKNQDMYELEFNVNHFEGFELPDLYENDFSDVKIKESLYIYDILKVEKLDISFFKMELTNYSKEEIGELDKLVNAVKNKVNFIGNNSICQKTIISDSVIEEIPSFITSNLTEIQVYNSKLDLEKLLENKNLYVLILESLDINDINAIPNMHNLETLVLNKNHIRLLENLKEKFPNLENIFSSYNEITIFPDNLPKNISNISFRNNYISGILKNLPLESEVIDLRYNNIEKVVFEEKDYVNEVLELSYNKIESIENIEYFKSDNTIHMDYNPIINNLSEVKKLNDKKSISVLPRLIYENKEEVIGSLGIIENLIYDTENIAMVDEIIMKLKYDSAMNGKSSEKIAGESENFGSCFLIRGGWGVGKTYFYKNQLKDRLEAEKYDVKEYVSILNNEESPFNTMLIEISSKEGFLINFFKEVWKRKKLIIVLFLFYLVLGVSIDFFKFHSDMINSNKIISFRNNSFDFWYSVLENVKISLIMSTLTLPLSLLQKNQQYVDQEKELKNRSNGRKVLIVDDLERVKAEKQIEIINAIQTMKNYIYVIVLMDEQEFKKILKSYYGEEFNYNGYKAKIFDYEYEYMGIEIIKYFEENVVIRDKNVEKLIKQCIDKSDTLKNFPIRNFKKLLITVFQQITLYNYENNKLNILEVLSKEIVKECDEKKLEKEKNNYILLNILSIVDNKSQDMNIRNIIKDNFNLDFYLYIYEGLGKEKKEEVLSLLNDNQSESKIILVVNDILKNNIKEKDVEVFISFMKEIGKYDMITENMMLNTEEEVKVKLLYYLNNVFTGGQGMIGVKSE